MKKEKTNTTHTLSHRYPKRNPSRNAEKNHSSTLSKGDTPLPLGPRKKPIPSSIARAYLSRT